MSIRAPDPRSTVRTPSDPGEGTSAPTAGARIGLSEALRLLTAFSLRSRAGGTQPAPEGDDVLVPVPQGAFCCFVARPRRDLDEGERDAFGRFYARVGDELEELAERIEGGAEIDEAAWAEITAGVTVRKRSA